MQINPNEMQEMYMRKKVKEILNTAPENQIVSIMGWVRTKRDSKGGFSFLEVNDGSCLKSVQIVCDKALQNYESEILDIKTGYSVGVQGKLVKSQGTEQPVEIFADDVRIFGAAPEDYPLQKKRHSFEFLREIAHLRPRSNTFGAVMRVRSGLAYSIHKFFQERGFVYVHTPIITASDCEGAGELFKVTTFDLENIPKAHGKPDFSQDFFNSPAYLTVSGQLEGEVFACALSDVYTFGPTFRAENSNTPRHLAEFWMVEPEMAFCELEDDAKVAVDFIKYLAAAALNEHQEDMELFNKFIQPGIIETLENIIKNEFKTVDYTEGVKILEGSGESFEYPVSWGANLQAEHEKYLTEKYFKCPIVLINFPACIKPFYMYVNDDGKTVRGMDVLVPQIGEIIGGSQREHRMDVLLTRMNEAKMNPENYSWYVDLRRYGSIPHAGFGLGFERLIQFVTGMKNIRDVIPFPRTPGNAKF